MVNQELWDIVTNPEDYMLCVGCVEDRLGRELNSGDFTSCRLNEDLDLFPHSERLLERLTRPVEPK
jgi:hypothetical protein